MVPIHFSQVILLSGVLVSQGVLGSSVLKSRDLLDHLLARQNDPSNMCETTCNNITSTFSNCNRDQTCICTISNAQMFESCVDCVVAIDTSINAVAMGQVTLDEFNAGCQGSSIPTLVVGSSPPGSLEPVSATSSTPPGSGFPGLSFSMTPPSPVTQSVVTVTVITSMSGSAGFTPLYHAPCLVVVGVVAGIVLALV